MTQAFIDEMVAGYGSFEGEYITLGKAKLDHEVVAEAPINIPLKTLNRHGLIAGATGTGKTKSVQLLVEGLSQACVPSLVMDIKGDLSGLAQPGDANNKHIVKRHDALEMAYTATGFPVELMSLSEEHGVPLRSTVSEFGPILFSKILSLNETQTSVIEVIFAYCDSKGLGLVDLKDVKTILQRLLSDKEEKAAIEIEYGKMAESTLSAILRSVVALEKQGGDTFFAEPSFEVFDLMRSEGGKGMINILRLTDMQDKPRLFSTFMLSLLDEVYATFPEAGDSDKPRLVIVIDEAHLVFKEASSSLLAQIETVIKLIRSKGVGIFFCTQLPDDVPSEVLSQLGCKIQHALRGFTEKDRKAIKTAVENYPISDHYTANELIMELGIGEAFVTCLNEKGVPTPLAHTYLTAPASRMDILTQAEIDEIVTASLLVHKYKTVLDKETAFEMLQDELKNKLKKDGKSSESSGILGGGNLEKILQSKMAKTLAKEAGNLLIRSVLGSLGLKIDGRRSFF